MQARQIPCFQLGLTWSHSKLDWSSLAQYDCSPEKKFTCLRRQWSPAESFLAWSSPQLYCTSFQTNSQFDIERSSDWTATLKASWSLRDLFDSSGEVWRCFQSKHKSGTGLLTLPLFYIFLQWLKISSIGSLRAYAMSAMMRLRRLDF